MIVLSEELFHCLNSERENRRKSIFTKLTIYFTIILFKKILIDNISVSELIVIN